MLAGIAATLIAATACGSTVQSGGAQATGLAGDSGLGGTGLGGTGLGDAGALGAPGALGADGLGGAAPGELASNGGTGTAAGAAGTAGGPGTFGSGAASGTSGQAPGSAAGQGGGSSVTLNNGPGVTAKEIFVGYAYDPGADKYKRSLGGGESAEGDTRRVVAAIAADINRRGGIAGRTLKMVYHEVGGASETNAQQAQAACETYSTDTKVFAAVASTNPDFRACTLKAGILNVVDSPATLDDAEFQANPHFVDVSALSLDRVGSALIAELVARQYFAKWNDASGQPGGVKPPKVGIIVPDLPAYLRVVKNIVLPRLKAAGYPVDADNVQVWPFPNGASESGAAVASIQSAVLKFRNDGVTHVLPMEVNSLGFFAQPAENQGYRPRYGLSSTVYAQRFAGGPLVPYSQLNGALGLGWFPAEDIPGSAVKAGGPYVGPGRAACLDVMKKAGISPDPGAPTTAALGLCNQMNVLDSTIEAIPAGSAINMSTFMQALQGPTSFKNALLPTSKFLPGRRYPVTHGYHLSFNSACPCMQYTGSSFQLP
jgi:hypothetical protein